MDFSESDLSSYPMIANPDYSPTNEPFSYPDAFDKEVYFTDSYTTQPDYSLSGFLDCDSFFDGPLPSVEHPVGFKNQNQASLNTASFPAAATNPFRPPYNPVPFTPLEQFAPNLSFEPLNTTTDFPSEPTCVSPHNNTSTSPTPSLCGDGPKTLSPHSPALSPRALKRESPEPDCSSPPPRPQRKRGRPRLDRSDSDMHSHSTSSAGSKCPRTSRLPHNQVERKYREGLNSELERLRRTVPTLPQSDESASMGQAKPSKAMVLAGAIEYIKKIERERDVLLEENEMLRGNDGEWRKRRRQDSTASSFSLMESQ